MVDRTRREGGRIHVFVGREGGPRDLVDGAARALEGRGFDVAVEAAPLDGDLAARADGSGAACVVVDGDVGGRLPDLPVVVLAGDAEQAGAALGSGATAYASRALCAEDPRLLAHRIERVAARPRPARGGPPRELPADRPAGDDGALFRRVLDRARASARGLGRRAADAVRPVGRALAAPAAKLIGPGPLVRAAPFAASFWPAERGGGSADGHAEPTRGIAGSESSPARRPPDRSGRAEPAIIEHAVDTLEDLFYVFDRSGTFLAWNDRLAEVTGYADEEFAELTPLDLVPEEEAPTIAEAIRTVFEEGTPRTRESHLVTKDGERIPYEFTGSLLTDDRGTVVGLAGVGRDITERKRRERKLERLDRLNAIIRRIVRVLVEGSTREEIERRVCERLLGSDLHRFAWIGDASAENGGVTPRTWVNDAGAVEAAPLDADLDGAVQALADAAAATGDIRVADAVGIPEPAREGGAGTCPAVAVPLRHGDTVYGVLVVYGSGSTELTVRERAVYAELGEAIGYAINAVERKRLQVADAVAELDLRSSDRAAFLVDLSARESCRLALEGVTPAAEDEYLFYVRLVEGGPPARIERAAAEHSAVEATRVIAADREQDVLEVAVSGPSIVGTLVEAGAAVRTAVADRGEGRFVAHVAGEADVGPVVRAVEGSFPDTCVAAKRRVEPPDRTVGAVRRAVEDLLTERQREVLRAAWLADYFAWPRGSTAEEVADSMGVSAPTFHEHLRAAQRKLVSALFELDRERAPARRAREDDREAD